MLKVKGNIMRIYEKFFYVWVGLTLGGIFGDVILNNSFTTAAYSSLCYAWAFLTFGTLNATIWKDLK